MKKLICFLIAFAILFPLLGCTGDNTNDNVIAENDHYRIEAAGEKYYLSLKGTGSDTSVPGACVEQPAVRFSSLKEMKEDILTGNFTEAEVKELQRFSKNEEGKVEICSMQKLYEPAFPSDLEIKSVVWTGRSYNFVIGFKTVSTGSVWFTMNHTEFSNYLAEFNTTYGSVETVEDRNATIDSYRAGSGKDVRLIKYTITTVNNTTLYINECYSLDESSTVPNYVQILVDSGGIYLFGTVNSFESRPSVEWLSKIGVREYVETEVA